MKKLIFIIILSSMLLQTQKSFAYEMFVSGIWQEGSFRDEPRPAESKYLKVTSGGFHISGEWAEYKLSADIIGERDESFLLKVEYENPLNAEKPFIQESLINPQPGDIELTSPFIKGLEVKKDYRVKITLYDSKKKKEIIDELTQFIRSYVDSRSRPIKFWGGIRQRRR